MQEYSSSPKHSTLQLSLSWRLCSTKRGALLIEAMTQADLSLFELSEMSGGLRSALPSAARLFQVTPVTSTHSVRIQIGRCLLPENFILVSSAMWVAVGGSNPLFMHNYISVVRTLQSRFSCWRPFIWLKREGEWWDRVKNSKKMFGVWLGACAEFISPKEISQQYTRKSAKLL